MKKLKYLKGWVLCFLLIFGGLNGAAEPTAQADLEALRHSFEAPQSPEESSLTRLKQRLAPLPERLKQLLKAQEETGTPGGMARVEQGLASSRALVERSPKWQQFPQKAELKTLLDAAQTAQAEAARQQAAGQDPKTEQARARQLTEAALALLQQPPKDPQEGQNPKDPNDQGEGQQSSQSQDSKPQDQTAQNQQDSKEQQKQPQQSSPEAQAQKLDPKEALKELLKLQQQAQQQKEDRREKMGLYRSGPQPVERDW